MAASDAAWNEQDSKEDNRRPLSTKACFHVPDTTLNVMVGTTGNILMALNEGGLHYLFAGARANVGILAGRYMFEVRILELLSQAETGVQLRTPVPKHVLRVGFSTARSTPIMGDNEESICFDSDGGLLFNRKRIPLLDAKYGPESTVAVVLNLDSDSPNMNTVSLYRDGQRLADPQMLPESLQGKALFPTLTYKNMNLHVNFGPASYVPLPFKCKMIQEAATDDVEVVTYPPPEDGRYEVLFPVCLPGEGTFHWADWFLERNPHYVELSERMVVDWASRSGIYRPKVASVKASNDRPEMNFGMPHLDEGTVKQILQAAAATQQRDILFLEVRNNLLKEERKQSVLRFRLPHFKRVAKVMMGLPSSDYLEYVYEQLRKEKQEKADAEFELQRQHATQQKLLEMQEKQAEWAQQREAMQQEAAAAAEAGEGEAAPPAAAPAEEEAKKTTEMEVDGDGEPPRVELTEEEKKHWHRRLDAVPDLAPSALSACFADFSLPDPSEGFDEVLYPWQSPVGVNDYLRQWIQEHKLTTRIEDLQPSEWFKEKWQKWQKDLQGWHAKHVEYKDPVKRAALLAAKAKAKEEANDKTQEAEDGEKDPKRRKLSPENGEKGDETKDEAKETAKTDEESKEAVVDTKQDAATEAKEETKEEAKEDLEKFTVPQLKDKLRAAGLMVSGNKADLIKRLQAAKEAEANKTSTEPPPEQEGEKKEEKPDAPTAEAGKEEEKKDEAQDMQVDQEGEKKEEKGEEAAAGEADKEGDKKEEAESKEKEAQEEEDNVDYLKELDEEIEQADNDVFEIEDVTDIGTGEPLFFNFGFEDWALLSLRFELHLLAHAFLHDCGDPERSGIYPDHLLFYYNRYYKKGLNPKNYGVEGVEELVTLVRDSIVVCPPKVIESMLSPELEDNDIFVKLTEEARRERLRRLDAGDESARLKFATGSQSSAKASSKAPVIIPGKGVTKGEALPQQTLLQQQQRQQQVRQQMQMATAAAGPMGPGPMVPGPMQPGPMQRPWGPPAAAFGVPLAQQRAMMARQPWG